MFLEEGSSWEGSKRYCIKTKHVAIICAVVVAVGLIVGLSVGLTRSCDSTESGQGTTQAPSHLPPWLVWVHIPMGKENVLCFAYVMGFFLYIKTYGIYSLEKEMATHSSILA